MVWDVTWRHFQQLKDYLQHFVVFFLMKNEVKRCEILVSHHMLLCFLEYRRANLAFIDCAIPRLVFVVWFVLDDWAWKDGEHLLWEHFGHVMPDNFSFELQVRDGLYRQKGWIVRAMREKSLNKLCEERDDSLLFQANENSRRNVSNESDDAVNKSRLKTNLCVD